jgi:signal transduction histidine kinase
VSKRTGSSNQAGLSKAPVEEEAPLAGAEAHATASSGSEDKPEMSIRILWCPAMFVRDRMGAEKLDELTRAAGFTAADVDAGKRWISVRQISVFLQSVRALVSDEKGFEEACLHRLNESYGPIRYLLWATTPKAVLKLAVSVLKPLLSRVSQYQLIAEAPFGLHLRYTSDVPAHETRLLCIGRRVQAMALPTMWGLPTARVTEDACIARGDASCDYHFRWYAKARWFPAALGAIVGGAGAAILVSLGLSERLLPVVLPMLGAALAWIYELRRTEAANLALGSEIQGALRALADDAAQSREEIFALHQRQQDWTRLLEEQVAERTEAVNSIVERIQQLREQREQNLRGLSHDLRNPMTAMRLGTALLQSYVPATPRVTETFEDMHACMTRMDTILNELMQCASMESSRVRIVAASLDVQAAAARLGRRARAIAYGRDIHVSIRCANDVPIAIETDLMIFDRVTDNLLTNAAKYMDHGHLELELDGSRPGYLGLRVTDTGRGIKPEDLKQIFMPGGSAARSRAAYSFGVGLSVVVQLLDQVGGRLEVESVPGRGTTFCVFFPVRMQIAELSPRTSDIGELIARVVTIREPQHLVQGRRERVEEDAFGDLPVR